MMRERNTMPSRAIDRDEPVVQFTVSVVNMRNGSVMNFHTHSVFTKDFQEVHELLAKFGSFIVPIQAASMKREPDES